MATQFQSPPNSIKAILVKIEVYEVYIRFLPLITDIIAIPFHQCEFVAGGLVVCFLRVSILSEGSPADSNIRGRGIEK